eukprot:4187491-Ditylum_brightwellii.AAC.1
MKQTVIAFQQLPARQLKCRQYHTYKLCTTPTDATLPIYKLSVPFFNEGTPEEWIKIWHSLQVVLKGQNVTQGPASYAVAKTLLKGNTLTVFEQAGIDHGNQTVPHFKLCLDNMVTHIFPEKVRQAQRYLKDFPVHNKNSIQPFDKDKLLDILEYGVPASWHREFTVQGFDPVDQGLQKFVEFYTRLELCEPSADKPKGEKTPKTENAGKLKADDTTPTKPA